MVLRGRLLSLLSLALLLAAALAGCLGGDDDVEGGTGGKDGTDGTDGTEGGDGGTGTDGDGGNETVDLAPVAAFTVIVNGTIASFNATGSLDPENGTLTFAWDLGDNNTATQPVFDHDYGAAGEYVVRLTVSDPAGNNATAEQNITIAALGFTDSVTGTVAQPNPLLSYLPYVLNTGATGDLDHYKQACIQEDAMCVIHEWSDVPTTGTRLVFDMKGTGTGWLNLMVFNGDGERVNPGGQGAAVMNVNQKVTLEDADAQAGSYTAFVYMPVGSNISYTLNVTLS